MALYKKLGIDLGTANSLVWEVGKGVVLNEPTVVARSLIDNKVLAVGSQAKQMLGKTPEYISVARPMRDGVVADYEATEALLSWFIKQVVGDFVLIKPEVMICVPAGCTQVEQRAVLDATLSAGARLAYLIDEPLAAAIGAQIPITSPSGNIIVDIGGGSCEVAVISLGGVVAHRSLRVAGNKMDEAIAFWLRKKYNLIIGDQTAERIKIKIGAAIVPEKDKKMAVRGRDAISGLPRKVVISSSEVAEAIQEPLSQIVGAIKDVLEETPPELVADIVDRGIVLSGGTALLNNLDNFLTRQIGVACHVVEEPLLSVVKGTGIALENLETYKKSLKR
jgi:rod shape-determining protein MreB